jgi:hypothetical protein
LFIIIIIIIIFISFPFIIYWCSTIDLEVVIKYNITFVTLLINSFIHFIMSNNIIPYLTNVP